MIYTRVADIDRNDYSFASFPFFLLPFFPSYFTVANFRRLVIDGSSFKYCFFGYYRLDLLRSAGETRSKDETFEEWNLATMEDEINLGIF